MGLLALAGRAQAEPPVLQSGKPVDIVSIAPFKAPQGWTALSLTYRTDVPLGDYEALRRESDEVWDRFVIDVEHSGNTSALITAQHKVAADNEKPVPSYNFAYSKQANAWRSYDFGRDEPRKLDEARVRGTIARFDAALQSQEMNAALLYLGDHWSLVIETASDGKPIGGTMSRMQFVELAAKTMNAASNFHHTRTITKITIASDGNSAEVTSEEAASGLLNGQKVNERERTLDQLGIEASAIVLQKTFSSDLDPQ